MRPFPLITAAVVVAFIYALVIERDRLFEFAGVSVPNEEVAQSTTAPAATEAQDQRVGVVAIKSQAKTIESVVLVRGRTEAARQVSVQSETSGKVISEPLRKGAVVEPGQMLCQLDPGTREVSLAEAKARLPEAQARIPEAEAKVPEAEARLVEARARLAEAEVNLTAARKLFDDGFASETRVKSAEAAHEAASAGVISAEAGIQSARAGIRAAQASVQSAEAGIAAAQREIDRLTITAPFGGILESDAAETGTLLQPGALCATVIQLDPIKLVGFVPEIDIALVKIGAPAGARLATGEEIVGRVTFTSRSADPTTRTFRVEVTVPNPNGTLRDGQTVEIAISSDGQLAHLLPLSALTLDDEGTLGVRLVGSDQRVEFAPVTVLRDTVDGIWVGGLADTADVIVVGQEFVTSGVPVRVTYREAQG